MSIQEWLNHDIKCSCGKTHRCDIAAVEIGRDALLALPAVTARYTDILLVADGNTYPLCGERVKNLLGARFAGICLFDTTDAIVPDEGAVKKIEAHLTDRTDLILGIGSGVINDLCKYVSFYHGIESGIIATAPSMDGYASSGAAMILGGMKVTDTTHAPNFIIGDTEILKNAPMHMIRAGYGDIIGKYSSLCDWELAHLILGEHFCKPIYELVMQTTNEVRDSVDGITNREDGAIEGLMRALVLIGMTLTLVETTRPGSGSEHHLSHFFEIVGLVKQERHLAHGTDVAYNAILTAGMREQILRMKTPVFCAESDAERRAAWARIYGPVAEEVEMLQRNAGSYARDLTAIYTQNWEKIREILSKCPSAAEIRRMIEAVGLHFTECEETYGYAKICDAMLYGKDLKNRYSVLWLYYALFSGKRLAVDYRHYAPIDKTMQYDFGGLSAIFARIPHQAPSRAAFLIKSYQRIFVHGAGRSGLMMRAFAMRLAQAGYTVFAVGDVTTPAIEKTDLLILASASGETDGVVRCARVAKSIDATVFALTAKEASTLASLSDEIVCLPAATKNDAGSGIMGTLFEQAILLFGDAVIAALGADATAMRARHANLE